MSRLKVINKYLPHVQNPTPSELKLADIIHKQHKALEKVFNNINLPKEVSKEIYSLL
jgi:hypothetical protein